MKSTCLTLKYIFCITLIAITLQQDSRKLPVFIIPGLGDSCENANSMGYELRAIRYYIDNEIYCIDSSPGIQGSIFTSFSSQVDKACSILNEKYKEKAKNGFNLIGQSQGGLVARGVIEKCDLGVYAKRLITLGSPHQGVAQIPHTAEGYLSDALNKLMDWNVYGWLAQHLIGPAGYVHRIDDEASYFKSGTILADLNNVDGTPNEEYKNRIKNLDVFVMIMFSYDTMIIPKETAHFAFYKDSKKTDIVKLEDSDLYKRDLIGLKTLVEQKRVFYHEIAGDHLQFSFEGDWVNYVFPYLHMRGTLK